MFRFVDFQMGFDVTLDNMGKFENNRELQHIGGEMHVLKRIIHNRWSYFKGLKIVEDFKYWFGNLHCNIKSHSSDSDKIA